MGFRPATYITDSLLSATDQMQFSCPSVVSMNKCCV